MTVNCNFLFFITHHMLVAGYYGITLVVRVSVRQSVVRPSVCCTSINLSVHPYFCFWTITWVYVNGFSPILVSAMMLWRSGLGLLMGKFHQFLTVICLQHDNGRYYHFTFLFLQGILPKDYLNMSDWEKAELMYANLQQILAQYQVFWNFITHIYA